MDSIAGARPIPFSEVAALPPGLPVTVRLADFAPAEVGAKRTAMLQVA